MLNQDAEDTAGLGRKPKSTPDAIILAAWSLFEKKGYQATTMTDIAEHAGISRRSLFNYFPHKEALLDPGLVDYMDQFSLLLRERPQKEPLIESIRAVVAALPTVGDNQPAPLTPGPEILRARLSDDAIAYTRRFCAREIREAVMDRLSGDPMAKVKAGLVSALASQVLTEMAHLIRDTGLTPDAALMTVLKNLSEIFDLQGA